MAKVEKPATMKVAPPTKRKGRDIPPITAKPEPSTAKPIQVKIPANMHQEIKLYAVEHGMTMTKLFLAMYKEYRAKHG